MKEQIIEEIKSLPQNTIFKLRDIFQKFNIEEKDMMKMFNDIIDDIKDHVRPGGDFGGYPYEVSLIKITMDEKTQKLIKECREKFDAIDYDFYVYYSLDFGEAKISPTCFALLYGQPGRYTNLYIIDDQQKTQEYFNDFLKFVKTAHREERTQRRKATGIGYSVKWANKFKYMFKKKPSADEVRDFLKKIFKENGFNV